MSSSFCEDALSHVDKLIVLTPKTPLKGFPAQRTSEMAPNVEIMDARLARHELGPLSEGKAGWVLWALARAQMCEIIQEVSQFPLPEQSQTIFAPKILRLLCRQEKRSLCHPIGIMKWRI